MITLHIKASLPCTLQWPVLTECKPSAVCPEVNHAIDSWCNVKKLNSAQNCGLKIKSTWLERQAEAEALEVASTAFPSLMQSLVKVTAAATASALTRAACAQHRATS